jgi:hypothetical protein
MNAPDRIEALMPQSSPERQPMNEPQVANLSTLLAQTAALFPDRRA